MDESSSLKTASLYINNQLLSRGLLRNGQSIDFARPERADGGAEATMGRVMGVVNDLILRRDRDATQRETLTNTVRTMKADTLRQTSDLERITTKLAECQRKLGISEATERAAKLQLKSAENRERGLREDMVKMKELVKQTRNQCAVEVRKRERVIEGLKKHVGDGRVRGGGKSVGVREVVIVPGVGEKESNKEGAGAMVGVGEEGYDLRSETNEFLTELARGLSEENENLLGLGRRTLENLRTLSGWEKDDTINGTASGPGGAVVEMEMGYELLAGEMEAVIQHVRTLLTNPSFVPLEEVEIREEEIGRLKEGWERMESRWREAMQMMDGWRKRMARSGQTVNLEELKMGMLLSPLKPKGLENEERFQLSTLEEEGEGDTQADIDAMDEIVEPGFDDEMDEEEEESSLFEDDPMEEEEEQGSEEIEETRGQEQEQEQDQQPDTTFQSESSAATPPRLSPLKETSGNRRVQPSPVVEPCNEGFSTIEEENTYDLLQLAPPSPEKKVQRPAATTPRTRERGQQNLSTPPEDEVSLVRPAATTTTRPAPAAAHPSSRSSAQKSTSTSSSQSSSTRSTTRSTRPISTSISTPKLRMGAESRLPRPRDAFPPPQQSPLTMASIAAKLAASEREADAARVRAKLKAARAGRTASDPVRGGPAAGAAASGSGGSKSRSTTAIVDARASPVRRVLAEEGAGRGEAADGGGRDGEEEGEGEASGRGGNVGLERKRKAVDSLGRKAGEARSGRARANRRRSTLNPWELDSLLSGNGGVVSPGKGE